MNRAHGGQRGPGHVDGRGDLLFVPGVVRNAFGHAAAPGGPVIAVNLVHGAIVDQRFEP